MGIKHATTGAGLKLTNSVWSENHVVEGDALSDLGDLIPTTTATYDLGSATKTWAESHVVNMKSISGLLPAGTAITVYDASENARIVLQDINTTTPKLRPNVNLQGDLGTASYQWSRIYGSTFQVGSGGLKCISAPNDIIYITKSSGSSSMIFDDIDHATDMVFKPATGNTGYLGNASYAWKGINAYDGISYTQGTGLTFKWKDSSVQTLSLPNQSAGVAWTDEDLTADTSANAKIALLELVMDADTIGAGNYSEWAVRKNGTTPSYYPRVIIDKASATVDVFWVMTALVGMDSGQVIEYSLTCGAGWTVDCYINVLGYWE